jgi:hypothetical protein
MEHQLTVLLLEPLHDLGSVGGYFDAANHLFTPVAATKVRRDLRRAWQRPQKKLRAFVE